MGFKLIVLFTILNLKVKFKLKNKLPKPPLLAFFTLYFHLVCMHVQASIKEQKLLYLLAIFLKFLQCMEQGYLLSFHNACTLHNVHNYFIDRLHNDQF